MSYKVKAAKVTIKFMGFYGVILPFAVAYGVIYSNFWPYLIALFGVSLWTWFRFFARLKFIDNLKAEIEFCRAKVDAFDQKNRAAMKKASLQADEG